MDARCPCTMDQVGRGHWEKSPDGYYLPTPDCPQCGGSGVLPIQFPDEDAVEAFWIGRCPLCGSRNGGHLQLKGCKSPRDDPYEQQWPPPCCNDSCPQEHVEWIRGEEVLAQWYPHCPQCDATWAIGYLQRHNDQPPTPHENSWQCPKQDCHHAPMNWVSAAEFE